MDLDWGERRKGVLYSDLFKSHQGEKEEDKKKKNNTVISKVEGWSSISSSSSHSSPCASSSSGFSTPFYSDLSDNNNNNNNNNNEDFIAELTRQMAERMLQDEDDDEEDEEEEEENQHHNTLLNYVSDHDSQVYELKNQPPVSKKGQIFMGRRVKGTESAQQKQLEKTEQQHHYMQYRGRGRNGRTGSGMQAVFLGGSKSGSPGTGVFLPRVPTDPSDLKKKSGCSIVLMPTRVLQALELHFNQRNNSTLNNGGGPLIHSCPKDESTKSELEIKRPSNSEEEMQLPQEWTY